MANAKRCDRCGAYYDRNEEHRRSVNGDPRYYSGVCMITNSGHKLDERDLCDKCITEFKRFINGQQTKEVSNEPL